MSIKSNLAYSIIESFDNHDFVSSDYTIPSNHPIDVPIDVNTIIEHKIVPLIGESNDYIQTMNQINAKYHTIDSKLSGISNRYNDSSSGVTSPPGLRDVLNSQKKYDYNGTLFNYNEKRGSILDAVVEDSSTMVYTQHSYYILGTITVSALIIFSIIMAK
jgi:hypothetical protein